MTSIEQEKVRLATEAKACVHDAYTLVKGLDYERPLSIDETVQLQRWLYRARSSLSVMLALS